MPSTMPLDAVAPAPETTAAATDAAKQKTCGADPDAAAPALATVRKVRKPRLGSLFDHHNGLRRAACSSAHLPAAPSDPSAGPSSAARLMAAWQPSGERVARCECTGAAAPAMRHSTSRGSGGASLPSADMHARSRERARSLHPAHQIDLASPTAKEDFNASLLDTGFAVRGPTHPHAAAQCACFCSCPR